MNALFISNDNPPGANSDANTSYFRILIPMAYLLEAGHQIIHQPTPPRLRDGVLVDTLDWTLEVPETVLVERMIDPDRVKKLRHAGARRVVLTFDDNYLLLPQYSSANKFWKQALPGFLAALPLVDLVIVPSEKLADDFRHRCKKIRVVPNFHDGKLWDQPAIDNGKLYTLGWGGSEQHLQSWTGSKIFPALKEVLSQRPEWQLVIYGAMFGPLFEGAGIPVTVRDWVPFERWPGEVRGFDIGLAPLSGDYDMRRSFLKPLEYGLAGIPFIATDAAPYAGKVKGGLLVRNFKDRWQEALETLMDSQGVRSSMGTDAKIWADDYRMDRNVACYEEVLWGT